MCFPWISTGGGAAIQDGRAIYMKGCVAPVLSQNSGQSELPQMR